MSKKFESNNKLFIKVINDLSDLSKDLYGGLPNQLQKGVGNYGNDNIFS